MQTEVSLKLMTYNIGESRKDFGSRPEDVIRVIGDECPDILVVQELVETIDVDQAKPKGSAPDEGSYAADIASKCGFAYRYFGPTLSMSENMHVGKLQFVEALFQDKVEWTQGNAIFSHYNFARLGDRSKPRDPVNIPLYRPVLYEGNRDTDPRYAILTRINVAPVYPLVIGTHLATVIGERGGESRELPGRTEEAQIARFRQARNILKLLKGHMENEVVLLLGDLNAGLNETCISTVLEREGGFFHLSPDNPQPTHNKAPDPIDHIFVYPKDRLLSYHCHIVDTHIAQQASDHLPVVAKITIK